MNQILNTIEHICQILFCIMASLLAGRIVLDWIGGKPVKSEAERCKRCHKPLSEHDFAHNFRCKK
jgi:hypothetical protein